MGILQRMFAPLITPQAPRIQTREVVPGSMEDFAYRVLGQSGLRAYRKPTIREALAVPAVLNAVTKIANLTGSLTMEVLRDGERIERPPVIRRPNPLTTPRDFFRDVSYCMAVYGESWLWVAKREPAPSNLALALVPINPLEIRFDIKNGRQIIMWGDKEMPTEDMLQITYLREPGTLRGMGPLQLCGAAVSVAVEAQDWAANFYAEGGHPSIVIKHANELDPSLGDDGLSEADRLRQQWVDRPNNVPRIIDQNIDSVQYAEPNESGAQMLGARMYQNGEVANMFGMPGSLLEYNASGSSLNYKSIPDLMRQFVDMCLSPNYLEPIEQTMTDLLPRNQVAQFVRTGLLRADVKTQYEVATLGFEKGIIDRTEARSIVGLEPSIEDEPVPFAPPRAVPAMRTSDEPVRCTSCERSRMVVYGDGKMRCVSCKTINEGLQVRTQAPPAPPSVINVHPAPITFERGAVQVDAPDMSAMSEAIAGLANQKPPEVNIDVAAPDMSPLQAIADRPQPPTNVSISTPPDDTLIEAIGELRERIEKPRSRRIERDDDGRMIRLIEESA